MPWTIAWTAMGSEGVEVQPLVGVAAGEGVTTKAVGVSGVRTAVSVDVGGRVGEATVGEEVTLAAALGAAEEGGWVI